MADPTPAQKLAAMKAALSALGVTDADEAGRAVAAFWSQQALVQAPPSEAVVDYARLEAFIAETVAKQLAELGSGESPVMVTMLLDSDVVEEKAQIKGLGDKALALMKVLLLKQPAA